MMQVCVCVLCGCVGVLLPVRTPSHRAMAVRPPPYVLIGFLFSKYHFLFVAVCVYMSAYLLMYVSNGLSVSMSMSVSMFVCQ